MIIVKDKVDILEELGKTRNGSPRGVCVNNWAVDLRAFKIMIELSLVVRL